MPAPDPLLGAAIGRYQLVRVIGEGGMGRVYEGVNPEIGSRVAIKVLAAQFASDGELCERMFAEARAVNMIRHDGIVPALDLVRLADGRPVIVMELVHGRSMRDALAGHDAPLGGVVDVIIQVLDVLAAAHAVGIVHRDLKPDNILITPEGQARVLDFGIAKLMHTPADQRGPRTRTGVVLGTPLYMAPEHISGGVTDESVDLYALGVVLFEATTGRLPFEGATDFDVMRAHVDTPPPSARALRPEVPIELERVIDRALAKQPRDRFASATAMANALRLAAQALPDKAWRSLSPSGAAPIRPTVLANEPANAGRLDVATAQPARRAVPDARPTVADRPAPARSRWIAPVVASIATAGVFVAVLAFKNTSNDPPVASPPIALAHTDAPETPSDAATRIVASAPVDAPTPPRDATVHRALSAHEDHPDDVFAFADSAGFATCVRAENVGIAKAGQTRTLDRTEITERCIDAAIQRLAPQKAAASAAYIAVVRESDIPTTLAIPLIDFVVRRSPSSCNDTVIYEMLVYVLSQGELVSERYLAPAKATIARCLKDETFRKDFLEELHSSDSNLAKGACAILTEQKLVTSCH